MDSQIVNKSIYCCLQIQVKKALAQLIIAMAHHGYLELEGGQLMIEFIVRQCSLLPDLQVQL